MDGGLTPWPEEAPLIRRKVGPSSRCRWVCKVSLVFCGVAIMCLVLLYNWIIPTIVVQQIKREKVLEYLIQRVLVKAKGDGTTGISQQTGLAATVSFVPIRSPVIIRVPETTRIFVGSYGYMDVPPLALTGGVEAGYDITLVVPFVVTNASAFGEQINDFMTLEKTVVPLRLETSSILVTSWDFPVGGLWIDDSIEMEGLDSLAASTISNVSSTSTANNGGLLVGGDLQVCNSAQLAAFVPYGIRLGMYVGVHRVGAVDVGLLDLRNGCFTVPVNGTIVPPTDAAVRAALGHFFSRYLSGRSADVRLQGEAVVDAASGYRAIPPQSAWLNDVVRRFNVTHALPGLVGGVTSLISSMRILELGIALNNHTTVSSSCQTGILVNVTGQVTIRQPALSFLNVTTTSLGVSNIVVSEGSGGLGALVGQLSAQRPVSSTILANDSIAVVASWTMQPAACGAGGASAVGSIISTVFASKNATFSVRADALTNLTVDGMGKKPLNVTVSDMALKVSMPGLNGLLPPDNPVITEADVHSGNVTAAFITGRASLNNPTNVSATIASGGLEVDVYGGDVEQTPATWLGRAIVPTPLTVVPGVNNVTGVEAFLVQTEQNTDSRRRFLSMFARGIPVQLTLQGSTGSSQLDVLAAAFPSMTTTVELPPLVANPFISFVQISASWDSIRHGEALGKLTLDNPFSANVTAFAVNMKVYHKGLYIGYSNITFDTPVAIGGHRSSETPWIPLNVTNVDLSEFWALVGDIQVDTNGTISLGVGEYVEDGVYYAQSNISASFWHK